MERFSGCIVGRFFACSRMPHREGNCMEGFLYLTSRSETDEGVAKDKVLPKLGIKLGTPGPKPSTLSTRLPLYLMMTCTRNQLKTSQTSLKISLILTLLEWLLAEHKSRNALYESASFLKYPSSVGGWTDLLFCAQTK